MRFDVVDLRLFTSVVEAGSITGGAALINMALSAASARIAGMESLLGTQLLDRGRNGTRPTPAGHVLLQHARTILRNHDRMHGELYEFTRGQKGQVRLLTNTNAETSFLPEALGEFLLANPGINIILEEHQSSEICRAIRDGAADIGILSASQAPDHLLRIPFRTDTLVLVVARESSLAQREDISFAEALDHDFIGITSNTAMNSFLSEKAAEIGKRLKVRIQFRTFDGVCRIVGKGIGIGILPASVTQQFVVGADVVTVPLQDAWAVRQLMICVRQIEDLTPIGQNLVEHLSHFSTPIARQSYKAS